MTSKGEKRSCDCESCGSKCNRDLAYECKNIKSRYTPDRFTIDKAELSKQPAQPEPVEKEAEVTQQRELK